MQLYIHCCFCCTPIRTNQPILHNVCSELLQCRMLLCQHIGHWQSFTKHWVLRDWRVSSMWYSIMLLFNQLCRVPRHPCPQVQCTGSRLAQCVPHWPPGSLTRRTTLGATFPQRLHLRPSQVWTNWTNCTTALFDPSTSYYHFVSTSAFTRCHFGFKHPPTPHYGCWLIFSKMSHSYRSSWKCITLQPRGLIVLAEIYSFFNQKLLLVLFCLVQTETLECTEL